MIKFEDALEVLLDGVAPLLPEEVAITDCGGRILARSAISTRNQPPAATSAMDGYATRDEDARAGATLTIVGRAFAGAPFDGRVDHGQAVQIATGGILPSGAERVIMLEHVTKDGDRLQIVEDQDQRRFIRHVADDFETGECLARAGTVIRPGVLGLLAAANFSSLSVYPSPVVAIIPGGDELRSPGGRLESGQVVDSGSLLLAELVREWGGQARRNEPLPDDENLAQAALCRVDLDVDVVVTIGGASVGERDVVKALFKQRGYHALFERVAIQPGKPTWHARAAAGPLLLGLPGNPASAFVAAHLFLKPLLFALGGRTINRPEVMKAKLSTSIGPGTERDAFLRAHAWVDVDGTVTVRPFEFQDSSLQKPLAAANALIWRRSGTDAAPAGELADLLPIGAINSLS